MSISWAEGNYGATAYIYLNGVFDGSFEGIASK